VQASQTRSPAERAGRGLTLVRMQLESTRVSHRIFVA
jgi:hypothetical protein